MISIGKDTKVPFPNREVPRNSRCPPLDAVATLTFLLHGAARHWAFHHSIGLLHLSFWC